MRKLGVAARSLIVASGLWLAGYTYYGAAKQEALALSASSETMSLCGEVEASHPTGRDCSKEAIHTLNTFREGEWSDALAMAALWLGLAWLAGWIAIKILRWILAGREARF